jgi:hypothetical protein
MLYLNSCNNIAVSGLTITGISKGTAQIKVSATTAITDDASQSGYEEKIYSAEIKITVC